MLQFFLNNKKILFLLGLLLVALTLFARNIEGKKSHTIIDKLILAFFTPPLKITTQCIHNASQLWDTYFYLVGLQKENQRLTELVQKFEMDNTHLREQETENNRLRELLSFKSKFEYKMLPGEIIGRDPSSWFKTILVDKGSLEGVEKEAGVITPNGVVGKVTDVASNSSKVLLITDVNSFVDAIIKRSGARGVVVGYRENRCALSYVLKTEDIAIGDSIVSSGLNSIYPKGVQIGTVTNLHKDKSGFFQFIEVTPSVDFSKLHEVLIVLKENRQ